ncbi:MAG TPA: Rrf2 family transcriptional regulator [Pseudonocardiaceae bacterium]|jgi:Rrf2 family protein|nr:Rrf2 family transcriptional regulator [Pseudonocardiaceae bacterium]
MKLSQGVEWALHCVVLLSLVPAGASIRREQLAGHYGLPEAYLAKHLQAATRAGILAATSGPKGGYRLAKQATEITMLDIVEAIEGNARPFLCQEIRQQGSAALPASECRGLCLINVAMNKADNAWRGSLRSTTVAEIAEALPADLRDRNRTLLTQPAT